MPNPNPKLKDLHLIPSAPTVVTAAYNQAHINNKKLIAAESNYVFEFSPNSVLKINGCKATTAVVLALLNATGPCAGLPVIRQYFNHCADDTKSGASVAFDAFEMDLYIEIQPNSQADHRRNKIISLVSHTLEQAMKNRGAGAAWPNATRIDYVAACAALQNDVLIQQEKLVDCFDFVRAVLLTCPNAKDHWGIDASGVGNWMQDKSGNLILVDFCTSLQP